MALIRCPECGKEISDSAQVCPNCGRKIELGNKNEIMKTSLLADIGFTVLGIICAIFAFVAYYTVSTDAFVVLIILAAVLFIIGSVYGRLIRNNIFERDKMNKKIITIILTLSTMLFLVGCSYTNNESNGSDKNYTYNDLDENQKEIIDNVYTELGDWGYTYEPSAIPASKIKFFYEDSKLIFAAFHDYGGGNGGGSYSVYEIDENSGAVSGHSYDTLNENDVLNKRVLAVELLSGESFDVEASEDSQKDILANSYGNAVNE